MPLLEAGRLAFDQAAGPILDLVIEKPRLAQHAGPLGFDDRVSFDRQVDIVAHAAAERAGGIGDDATFFGQRFNRLFDEFCGAHQMPTLTLR